MTSKRISGSEILAAGPNGASDSGIFSSESGQSILELALLTPLMVLLLLGVIELGRYAYFAISVGNAARAGVAYGAQSPFTASDATGISNAACQDFSGNSTCSLNVNKTYVCTCDNAGTISAGSCTSACATGVLISSLQVTCSGSFTPLFPNIVTSSSPTVTSTATMRIGP